MTHRNRERERRAHSELALHPDLPTVEFHKLPAEGEPQPRAFHLLRRRADLAELLEDLLLILRGNTHPGVADGYLHGPVPWRRSDLDPPALGRELDRVRQQVQDHLTDLALVRLNLAQSGINI